MKSIIALVISIVLGVLLWNEKDENKDTGISEAFQTSSVSFTPESLSNVSTHVRAYRNSLPNPYDSRNLYGVYCKFSAIDSHFSSIGITEKLIRNSITIPVGAEGIGVYHSKKGSIKVNYLVFTNFDTIPGYAKPRVNDFINRMYLIKKTSFVDLNLLKNSWSQKKGKVPVQQETILSSHLTCEPDCPQPSWF